MVQALGALHSDIDMEPRYYDRKRCMNRAQYNKSQYYNQYCRSNKYSRHMKYTHSHLRREF